jgi:two-component sensor histidine kinase
MEHRVKNVLAVVGAIATQSFRGGNPAQLETFGARLAALADAQSLLIKSAWQLASIDEAVERALLPHAPPGRSHYAGSFQELTAKRSVALALAIHELATNAVKYGAFSNETGHVEIAWHVADGQLVWSWSEIGGPPVVKPERTGFGTRLFTRNLAMEFKGSVDLQHPASGIVLTLTAPA